MMRNKTSSSIQKTYDECYLICSTAVYFEGQVRISTDSAIPSSTAIQVLGWEQYANGGGDRAMKQRLYDHGAQHSTRSTITTRTACLQAMFQSPKPKRR
jgi:hypothetical protein